MTFYQQTEQCAWPTTIKPRRRKTFKR